jgi:hypothetical protein
MSVTELAPHLDKCIEHAAKLDKSNPLDASPTWTGNSLRVTPFLEAVANDAPWDLSRSCADQFEAMAEAVKNYYDQLILVEGADMPGFDDLCDGVAIMQDRS